MRLHLTISHEDDNKEAKQVLKGKLHISERLVKKLKYSGNILLNSVSVHVNVKVHEGDLLEAFIESDELNEDITPETMDLDILFEDDNLIAINKPRDTVVHPTSLHQTGTIANGLMHYLLSKDIKTLVRPVSRLDRDTSGIIIFALNPYIQENLVRQMHSNLYIKEYIGLVHGTMDKAAGTINLPIDRLPGSLMLRHVTPDGAPSVTHYEVIEQYQAAAYMKFRLETGRTHQIRVHCQATGHPLVGDTLYDLPDFHGKLEGLMSRQALHAYRTVFTHPYTHKEMELKAPVPADIQHALEILRNIR
ncbi:MAG TPA: RluA family pseudouridine synthase [Clostridia bacterium]|nr:RluA family pseudouridine synthase [Clostridia bacterium]